MVVSPTADTITWNATDPDGVQGSTLTIEGNPVTVHGPVGTPTSADFSASLGLLNPGLYAYTITATNTLNEVSTLSATFTLDQKTNVGPAISGVVVSESKARISWNALDPSGVPDSTLAIDGVPVSNVSGPFTAASGVNFSAPLDSLLAGPHTYSITAFSNIDGESTISGAFNLSGTTTFDPMISQVVVSQARGRISWNVFDPNGVTGTTLQIDGATVANIAGPFTAASGVNFSAALGSLAIGSHSYRITATDALGRQSLVLANFSLTAATTAAAGATQNSVFSSIGDSTVANSAKVAWMFDLGGLADSPSSVSTGNLV